MLLCCLSDILTAARGGKACAVDLQRSSGSRAKDKRQLGTLAAIKELRRYEVKEALCCCHKLHAENKLKGQINGRGTAC